VSKTKQRPPRQLGVFRVSRVTMQRWEDLLPLFAQLVVVRCEFHYAEDEFEYVAYSPVFNDVPDGTAPLKYQLVFKEKRFRFELPV
jgi:hypothetical protein